MLDIDERNGVRVVRMAHGKASALDVELCQALERAFAGAGAGDARAVVLTGSGKIFSAGVDLPRLLREGAGHVPAFLQAMDACFRAMLQLERPVVAAINGHAIAGGCILACACDVRLMAEGTGTIGAPELAVGVPFPPLALEIVRQAIGTPAVRRLTLSCERLPPERALATGLVDRLVAAAELESAAVAEARRLAEVPVTSFALHKRQLWVGAQQRSAALREHALAVERQWQSREATAAIAAFVERTLRR